LITSPKAQSSDARLIQIIHEGAPAAGMPAFRNVLAESTIHSIVSHLRVLQGRLPAQAIPGDPQKGRLLFFGKARCSDCHMIQGEGGFIGPDLSQYGQFKAPDDVRNSIVEPGKSRDRQKTAVVTTQDGQTYTGTVRNEDNFSLQLQTLDGAFHLFMKSDLKNLEYGSASLMPSDYGSLLTKSELDDLVSFLIKRARPSGEVTESATPKASHRFGKQSKTD
jgi:putative heme-binding domain-containing protein